MLLNKEEEIETKIRTEPFLDYYEIEAEIGRGKFACVKRCRHRKSGAQFAAKFLRKRRKGKDCRQDILAEVWMLELARVHPRLVNLVEVFESSQEVIIVTEYAEGGELFRHVQAEGALQEDDVIQVLVQLCEGVAFLHEKSIVHLDVKPQNVLLTCPLAAGPSVMLCDFGFARTVNSGEDVRDIIGTPDYVAPEVLNYDPIWQPSDMWSVGVCAYVLLTGCSPFAGETKQGALEFPEDLFSHVSQDAQDFISKLLVLEPSARLTASQCLSHPWLARRATPVKPPFGSPLGCRRALTPPSPDSNTDIEPSKKHKAADTSLELHADVIKACLTRRSSDGSDVIRHGSPAMARSNSLRRTTRSITPVPAVREACDVTEPCSPAASPCHSLSGCSLRVPSNASSTTSITEALAGSSVQAADVTDKPRSPLIGTPRRTPTDSLHHQGDENSGLPLPSPRGMKCLDSLLPLSDLTSCVNKSMEGPVTSSRFLLEGHVTTLYEDCQEAEGDFTLRVGGGNLTAPENTNGHVIT